MFKHIILNSRKKYNCLKLWLIKIFGVRELFDHELETTHGILWSRIVLWTQSNSDMFVRATTALASWE